MADNSVPPNKNNLGENDILAGGLAGLLPQNFDITTIIRQIWARKWLIIGFGVLGLLVAQVYVSQSPVRYKASVSILRNETQTNIGESALILDRGRFSRDFVAKETYIIKSDNVLSRVAENIDLQSYPDFNPSLRELSLIQRSTVFVRSLVSKVTGLFSSTDEEAMADDADSAKANKTVRDADEVAAMRLRKDARRIARGVIVSSPQQSNSILTISYVSSDPKLSVKIVNMIANEYLNEQLEAKFEATERASEWLTKRLDTLRKQVETAEAAVVAYKSQQTQQFGQSTELLQEQITQLNGQLINAKSELTAVNVRKRQVDQLIKAENYDGVADFLNTEDIFNARTQIKSLKRREAEMSTRYGDRHPKMVSLRAEVADAQMNYEAQIQKGIQAIETDRNIAQARVDTIRAALRDVERVSSKSGKASIQQRQYEREAQASRMVYQNFLERFNATSEQEGLTESDGRIISEARGASRVAVNGFNLTVGGVVVGLILGVGIASVMIFLEPGFRSARDLEAATGLPVLGQIPMIGQNDHGMRKYEAVRSLIDTPNSALAEAIRALRVGVTRSNIDHPPQVILTTSAVPQEGKSAASALLAMTCMQFGQKAILVDADLRRPSVAQSTGVEAKYTVVDVLEGNATLDEAIATEPRTGLDVLVGKNIASNANAVVASAAFANLINELRERYDIIVIDAPPVMAVSDAVLIAGNTDMVLFSVLWGGTPTDIVRNGLKILHDASVNVGGTVLSRVDVKKQARYGYAEYGYYQGRYGDYYGSKD